MLSILNLIWSYVNFVQNISTTMLKKFSYGAKRNGYRKMFLCQFQTYIQCPWFGSNK